MKTIRDALNWLLNHFKERPSDEELIAYGRQLAREEMAQGFAKVEIIAPPPAAYDVPSPTTDGKIAAERLDSPRYIEMIRTKEIQRIVPPYHKMTLLYLPPTWLN